MQERKSVIIDAGHGGSDPGAVYEGRQEKDDALNLALAVGRILENNGVDVMYTRINDVYDTPLERLRLSMNRGQIIWFPFIGMPCPYRGQLPGS